MVVARNTAIILGLAALVSFAPGGLTAATTVSNIFSVLFFGGLAFFAFRMYMEHRITLYDLPEPSRIVLYACTTLLVFALLATSRLWDQSGVYVLLWFMLIGVAVYGLVMTVRRLREY